MTTHEPIHVPSARPHVSGGGADDAASARSGVGRPGDWADLDAAAAAFAASPGGAGDQSARREELIRLCLPFARRMARRYRGRGESLEDIEQVARLGLVKAIDRYDPMRGSFTAYAVVTVSGEIKRHFRDRTWGVHVPRRVQELILQVGRATADLTGALARTPTAEEIAARLAVPVTDVREALESSGSYSPSSLNAPVTEDGGERGDLVGGPDGALEMVDDRVTVAGLLLRLPVRERRMLAMRFYGNCTQAEIATELGISQMHVSRLLTRALTWLREAMLSDEPPLFAGDGPGHCRPVLESAASRDGSALVVRVWGEIDRDDAERLRLGLRGAIAAATEAGAVVIDLSGVPLMDAAGIAVLRDAASAAAVADVRLRLAGAQPYVVRILAYAGMSALLEH